MRQPTEAFERISCVFCVIVDPAPEALVSGSHCTGFVSPRRQLEEFHALFLREGELGS